jgi:hypothetical protein
MGKKTSLTALHLGINKTTSFLSVETFTKDLRLSFLHNTLFITKLRIGWRPLKFFVKNRRFPKKKPFLYTPKYFYHSIKIIKFCNKVSISVSIWDIKTDKTIKRKKVRANKRAKRFSRKDRHHFRKPLFSIARGVYKNAAPALELKVLFQKGSSWLKKLSRIRILRSATDSERFRMDDIDYSYLKQKEFRFLIKHKQFGFLMQCFLYATYELNTNLLLKLFAKTLAKTKKKKNKGRIMMKHFFKMMRLFPFFFNGETVGLTIFLRGRLWLSFRKKRLKLSFGAIKRNSFKRLISESTGKVFTHFGVFGVRILMSQYDANL